MGRLFLVFGTPGAGKSALMKGVKSAKTISIGTEMLNAYSKKSGLKDRDLLRKSGLTSYSETVQIRVRALKKIVAAKQTIALDTHASVKSGDGYIPGLSFKDFEVLKGKVKAIIYVDANTNEILRRRQADTTRKREPDSAEELNKHRSINLMFSTLYSLYLEAPIYIVENNDRQLASAQKHVEDIIRKTR